MGIAVALVSTFIAIVCAFSGFVSLSVPNWLAAMAWATPVKAAGKVQFINECIGLKFYCDTDSIVSGKCVATSGEDLLTLFRFQDLDTAKFIGLMLAAAVGWMVLAWAALRLRLSKA